MSKKIVSYIMLAYCIILIPNINFAFTTPYEDFIKKWELKSCDGSENKISSGSYGDCNEFIVYLKFFDDSGNTLIIEQSKISFKIYGSPLKPYEGDEGDLFWLINLSECDIQYNFDINISTQGYNNSRVTFSINPSYVYNNEIVLSDLNIDGVTGCFKRINGTLLVLVLKLSNNT